MRKFEDGVKNNASPTLERKISGPAKALQRLFLLMLMDVYAGRKTTSNGEPMDCFRGKKGSAKLFLEALSVKTYIGRDSVFVLHRSGMCAIASLC